MTAMRTTWAVLVALFVTLAVIVFLMFDLHWKKEEETTRLFENQQLLISRQLANGLETYLSGREKNLLLLSSGEAIRNSVLNPRLASQFHYLRDSYVKAISVCDGDGRTVASTSKDLIGRRLIGKVPLAWAVRPQNKEKVFLLPEAESGTPAGELHSFDFLMVTPLRSTEVDSRSGGTLSGALVLTLDIGTMLVGQLSGTGNLRPWIMDQEGTLLFHSEHPEMIPHSIYQRERSCLKCHVTMDAAREILSRKEGTITYAVKGFPAKVAAFTPVEYGNARWILVLTSAYDDVAFSAKSDLLETLLLLGATLFAFLGASVLLFRNIHLKIKAEDEARQLREKHALEDRIKHLAGQVMRAQEDERRRISRELHDDINQKLAMLEIDLNLLERDFPTPPAGVSEQLRLYRKRVADLSDAVHSIAYRLHPSVLDDLGLTVALKSFIKDYSKREGITVTFNQCELPESLEQNVSTCLYRVAQESLRNIARHSRAKEACVSMECDEREISLEIKDSGVGFVPELVRRDEGIGLVSMQERVRLLNGTFNVTSSPGQGTQISVHIPLTESAEEQSAEARG